MPAAIRFPLVTRMTTRLFAAVLATAALLAAGCAGWFAPPPGVGKEISFDRLPGWDDDRQADAWPALLRSCDKLAARDPAWRQLCDSARGLDAPDDAGARRFFETHFRAYRVNGDGTRDGLVTGYYEPVLKGSFERSARYRFPLYRRPDNLLTVDLATLYPELRGRPVRGRLEGNRVVPYHSRADIGGVSNPLAGSELLWVDDAVQAFILQVQGSGRVELPDGSQVAVGYADQNGHPYRSLGAQLVERGLLKREDVTLPRILDWLAANPDETERLLNSNPSFVFFRLREAGAEGPVGSLGVPLTPGRSAAVDPGYIALGLPLWLESTLPDGNRFRRLMMAHDTGGAIKGPVRADVFFGRGEEAARLAGEMKNPGRLYVLLPKPVAPETQLSRN
jgi:membrane-bound lytic murein transglycosylase A